MGKNVKNALVWPFERIAPAPRALPVQLITRKPFDAGGALDPIAALLLPSEGVTSVPQQSALAMRPGDCLGVWMGTGFPVLTAQDSRPETAPWVCNFPCTSLYDDAFTQSLSEVGLGPEQERANLARLKAAGCRVMLTVTPDQRLDQGAGLAPDMVLVALRSAADIERVRAEFMGEVRAAFGAAIPTALHGGPSTHLPRSPAALGVHAILHMPGSA